MDTKHTLENPGTCPNCRSINPMKHESYTDGITIIQTYTCICGTVWDEGYNAKPKFVLVMRGPYETNNL